MIKDMLDIRNSWFPLFCKFPVNASRIKPLPRNRVRKMRKDSIFWGRRRDLWDTPVGFSSRCCETETRHERERERERESKKAQFAGKPERAEGNKGKSREEKRMGKQIARGGMERERRRNAAVRKENCTKTRCCVAQLAGRDEGEKYPEGEIPDGRVCVRGTYVCGCIETATTG